LLTLPKGGSKLVVAATHAAVFAGVLYLTVRIFVEKFEDDDIQENFRRTQMHKNSAAARCFPASSTVRVDDGSEDGKKTQMSNLKIGDKVLSVEPSTGATIYSDVYFFGHRDSETVSNFYTVTTDSGNYLQLSPDHYMYVSENGCNDSIATATTLSPNFVKVGMGAWIHTPEGMKCSLIVEISQSEEKGLYNPQTLTGSILVNDIYASSYSSNDDIPVEKFLSTFMTPENVARCAPAAWHTLFAPVRSLYLANGAEWVSCVTRPYDVDGWKDLSITSIASTMIKESFVTA
jgi:hypothetical protein